MVIFLLSVVYLLIPTSNHNLTEAVALSLEVVYLLIPTSNHNWQRKHLCGCSLYIFWFLHQTTTRIWVRTRYLRCISFDSYIKPQHYMNQDNCFLVVYLLIPTSNHNVIYLVHNYGFVVYLLIPTSNHNSRPVYRSACRLYIFWFLHQTTTE